MPIKRQPTLAGLWVCYSLVTVMMPLQASRPDLRVFWVGFFLFLDLFKTPDIVSLRSSMN